MTTIARANSPLIYLASPYNHKSPTIRELRYAYCVAAVGYLLHKEQWVYSPIVHNHPVIIHNDLGRDWKFWKDFDLTLLERCSELKILMLSGWNESVGVRGEIDKALELGLAVSYMSLDEIPSDFITGVVQDEFKGNNT